MGNSISMTDEDLLTYLKTYDKLQPNERYLNENNLGDNFRAWANVSLTDREIKDPLKRWAKVVHDDVRDALGLEEEAIADFNYWQKAIEERLVQRNILKVPIVKKLQQFIDSFSLYREEYKMQLSFLALNFAKEDLEIETELRIRIRRG